VVGGSVQATALNIGAGARTRWSSVFTAAFVIVVILAAAPLVQQVPLAVTAGILIVAATSALQPRAARDVWRADKMSAAVMIVTFGLVLAVPLQYAVLAGAAISVIKYIYISSLDVHVKQVELCEGGLPRETEPPAVLASEAVTVLDIYGSLFFAAAPTIRECLPAVGEARCPVVVIRLRGRGTLHSATIAVLRDYAAECEAHGGRLFLAGVGREMEEQLERTGVRELLGPDAVVGATDQIYGACAIAQQRGRTWLATHADGGTPGPRAV
jgi:SulP family sulfate permease